MINVILVENHFNAEFMRHKPSQQRARRRWAEPVLRAAPFDYELASKAFLKARVQSAGRVRSFLDLFPIDDPRRLERAWQRKIRGVVAKLRRKGLSVSGEGH